MFDGGNDNSKLPLEKLAHFIEVGFLLDQKNFSHIDTYQEKSFDCHLNKYLYEFQYKLDNTRAVHLQNKIKQQLIENFALFCEINPAYVSLNLGRNISPLWDQSVSQEHFKLIRRESYCLSGEHYLTVNFLRCEEPSLVVRVIAFDNDTCSSYGFDLTFEDLMLFTDGNMRLLESDNSHDLCQMILNNLTRIRSKPASGDRSANTGAANPNAALAGIDNSLEEGIDGGGSVENEMMAE